MVVPHRGGLKLRTTDYAYDVLRQWIAEGAAVDAPEGTRCVQLELLPASGRVLKQPHWQQQIVARAHFDNGEIRDVTRLTYFTSSDEQLATVTPDGLALFVSCRVETPVAASNDPVKCRSLSSAV